MISTAEERAVVEDRQVHQRRVETERRTISGASSSPATTSSTTAPLATKAITLFVFGQIRPPIHPQI
jgi:hypothetical protein